MGRKQQVSPPPTGGTKTTGEQGFTRRLPAQPSVTDTITRAEAALKKGSAPRMERCRVCKSAACTHHEREEYDPVTQTWISV